MRDAAVACEALDVRVCEPCEPGCSAGETCATTPYGDCRCVTACTTDDACSPGTACVCAISFPVQAGGTAILQEETTCAPAQCRTSDDCDEGQRCAASPGPCGGFERLACTSPDDRCATAADCGLGELCTWSPGGFRCAPEADCM